MPPDGPPPSSRPRLVFVSHTFVPSGAPTSNLGGMQRVAMELASALCARSDVEVVLDVLRSSHESLAFRAPSYFASLPFRLARIAPTVDAILFSSVTSAIAALPAFRALRRSGVRLVAIAHGLDVTHPSAPYQAGVRAALSRLDLVIAVSESTEQLCFARGANATRVLANGVEAERFEDVRHARSVRARVPSPVLAGVPEDAFVLLSVGRQVKRKGFAWFASEVLPGLPRDVHHVFVGDGPERARIERAASERGIAGRVHVTGFVVDDVLRAALARADLFVMPNVGVDGDVEGFGVVLLEAACAGLPCVVAAREGMLDVVEDGRTGVLVASEDAAAWTRAIVSLRASPERREELAANALERARRVYAWPAIAAAYVDALGVMASRGSEAARRLA